LPERLLNFTVYLFKREADIFDHVGANAEKAFEVLSITSANLPFGPDHPETSYMGKWDSGRQKGQYRAISLGAFYDSHRKPPEVMRKS
jgi:hypothetical protein